jgi:hypothetical protein
MKEQNARAKSYAGNLLVQAYTIIGAGILLGIMEGTGMFTVLANAIVAIVPSSSWQRCRSDRGHNPTRNTKHTAGLGYTPFCRISLVCFYLLSLLVFGHIKKYLSAFCQYFS